VPLPKRFSEILAEFHQFIDDQKAQEKTEEEKQAAKERIKEIYEEIKEIIQLEIEYVRDLSPSDFGGEAEELEEKVKELKNDIAEIDKTVKEVAIESGEKTKELNLLKKKLPISITDIYY
jgi:DNA repair exonuclease SbcCD ATPase subunit